MCKDCMLLGALFNASELDCFPCYTLSQYDYKLSMDSAHGIVDTNAGQYLKDTLAIYQRVRD
jgi:hypothetical protein